MSQRSKWIIVGTLTSLLMAMLGMLVFNLGWLRIARGGLTKAEAALRYPYQQLTKREQALYRTLCAGIENYEETISLPDLYSGAEYDRVFLQVMMQEPQFFYLDSVYETGEQINKVKMIYDIPQSEITGMKAHMDAVADRILAEANDASSEFQRLRKIHDGIAACCEYSDGEYQDEAYGCLVEGKAKCEGYAKAFLYVCRRAGINAMNVPGTIGKDENHVWNIAEMDGKYYNVDVTWDDDAKYRGLPAHNCFAQPDSQFVDHRADLNAFTPPACTDDTHTYYSMFRLVVGQASALPGMIESWKDDPALIEFQLADKAVYEETAELIANKPDVRNAVKTISGAVNYRAIADETRNVIVILPS
ncbi:MAG: hypothetical protein MJ065_09945 [Oscillospiraceae bacterium]|nr:hypothetical protein [Oscillospiraceae bacterium]